MKKTSIIIFTVLLALFVFVSCEQSVSDLIGFNVAFNANGGTGTMEQVFVKGSVVKAPANGFTREGYTFKSWNTMADGSGDKYNVGDEINGYAALSITLFAQWEANTYTITIPTVEHGSVTSLYANYTVKAEEISIPLTVVAETGYGLASYAIAVDPQSQKDKVKVENDYLVISAGAYGNITVTPSFAANGYAVKFNANGATEGTMADQTFKFDETKALTANAFVKPGYTFAGWNTNEGGSGTSYSNEASVKNLTSTQGDVVVLYAQWTANTYTVTVPTVDHGSVTSLYANYTVKAEEISIPLTVVAETGYRLDSYAIAVDPESQKSNVKIENDYLVISAGAYGNITVTPTFAANDYKVKFNANGGEGTMADQSFTFDQSKALAANTFTKTGYVFDGWNTNEGGSGTSYADEASVKNLTSTKGDTVVLYAQWKEGEFTITCEGADHGTVAAAEAKYTLSSSLHLVELTITPAKGYQLKSITATAPAAIVGSTLRIPAGMAANITITAEFEPVVYNIIINKSDYGTAVAAKYTYTINTEAKQEIELTATSKDTVKYDLYDWPVEGPKGVTAEVVTRTKGLLTIPKDTVGDIYVTPNFLPKFTVTLHKFEGKVDEGYDVTSYFVAVGATLPTAEHFKKEGNTFGGWYDNSSFTGSKVTEIGREVLGEKEYWAKWSYSISYDKNNATSGDVPASQTNLLAGNDVTLRGNTGTLARTGYNFTGWNTVKAPSTETPGQHYAANAVVDGGLAGTTTLYAEWTANDYLVSFDKNDGSVVFYAQIYETYGSKYVLPETAPTRTGYEFAGWFTAKSGGTQVKADTTVATAEAHTLYAHWTAKKYTVTFYKNYGTETEGYATKDETYDAKYVLPETAPTRTGYTFAGWYTAATGGTKITAESTVAITSATSLYAHWTANNYEVKFYKNYGEEVSPYATKSETYDSTYALPATPTRTGYTFAGWFTAKSGGTQVKADTKVEITAATSLYAHWTANNYEVKFYKNDGTETVHATKSETYDAKYVLPETNPTRAGYTFAGWFTAKSGGTQVKADTTVAITAAQSLYAHWTANTFTVKFDKNAKADDKTATGTMSDEVFTYDVNKNLTAVGFSSAVYDFDGWNTKADGSGKKYADKESVKNLAESGTVTLYAQWKLHEFTITFVPDVGHEGYTITVGETDKNTYTYTYDPKNEHEILLTFKDGKGDTATAIGTSGTIPSTLTPYKVSLDTETPEIILGKGVYGNATIIINF